MCCRRVMSYTKESCHTHMNEFSGVYVMRCCHQVPAFLHVNDMTHLYVCDMTHLYVCDMTHLYVCDMTHLQT